MPFSTIVLTTPTAEAELHLCLREGKEPLRLDLLPLPVVTGQALGLRVLVFDLIMAAMRNGALLSIPSFNNALEAPARASKGTGSRVLLSSHCFGAGGLMRIECKSGEGIGSKRRGRQSGRRDPKLEEKEQMLPFLETQERMWLEANKQILVDAEILLEQSNSKFGLVLEIAEEANEYLRHNKDESLTRKPILKVISDRINEGAGEQVVDSYIEDSNDLIEPID